MIQVFSLLPWTYAYPPSTAIWETYVNYPDPFPVWETCDPLQPKRHLFFRFQGYVNFEIGSEEAAKKCVDALEGLGLVSDADFE